MLGLVSGNPISKSAIIFYFFAYLFMNLGAFAVVFTVQEKEGNGVTLPQYSGLGYKRPLLALAMTFFMLSLAGFPPTAGFMGKFYLFKGAIETGYIGLVIVAVLNSVVSAYYYLRVVVFMYMREPDKDIAIPTVPILVSVILFICILGVFYLGLFPSRVLNITQMAWYF
jgi:NADH-quinone oxidoreductase subunit N